MQSYTLWQRAEFYARTFPDWPAPRADDRWLDGIWVLGNNYKGGSLYGAYPPNYLRRVLAMFPDAERVLHLFSGSLPPDPSYTRLDLGGEPDILGNAEELSICAPGPWDLILADPPYSAEDAEHYGTQMVNRNKVVVECAKVIEIGGYLVWLDQVLPMFRKDSLHLCGLIGIVRSTNHRFRVASMFRKL